MIHCEWRKPRAPRPAAVEAIAAGRRRDLAGRRRRGGDAGRLVAAPDVVLRLFGEQRQHAGVVGEIIQAPRRRAAGRFAKLDGDVERHFVVVLVAAPALRLQRVNEPGIDEFVDRLLRDVAVALGPHGAFAQLSAPARARARPAPRRSEWRPARRPAADSATLMAFPPVGKRLRRPSARIKPCAPHNGGVIVSAIGGCEPERKARCVLGYS